MTACRSGCRAAAEARPGGLVRDAEGQRIPVGVAGGRLEAVDAPDGVRVGGDPADGGCSIIELCYMTFTP